MSDIVLVAIIAAGPGMLTAVIGGCGLVLSHRNRAALREIHLTLNSRLDQLISSSKDTGRIEEQNKGSS